MQFAGVDQGEALLAHVFESRNNLALEWLHTIGISPMTGEVQIEMVAQEPVGHAGETGDRILNNFPKKLLADLAVIDRNADGKLLVHLTAAFPKFEIVSPASEEKLPLQVRHIYQPGAGLL